MNTNIKIKFFITIALVFVMLLSMSTFSLSGEEYSVFIALKSSSTLNKGEIVTVNVTLIDINAGNGIDVIVAKLNYDTNVFEILTPNDFNSNTGWRISYSSSTNKLTAINNNKVAQTQTLFTINLKVKSTLNIDNTTISLQQITASGGLLSDGGTDDISINDISINIKKPIEIITPNYSVGMNLTSNSSLKAGEIINIYTNLSNINAGNGIDVITAKLNYDTNVFQMLTPNDFNSNTGWKVSYAPNSNILTAINKNKITQNQTVFHIRFKIKSEINIDTTTISLQNIMVSGGRIIDGGTDDISVNNASITLNRAIDVVTDSKTNDIKPNSAVEPNISIPTSNILNSKTLSTIETNINESANLKNEIINDINSNMAENSDLISKQIDVQNVAENLKTPEVLKETNSNDITIVKAQSQNSNKIQNTVIGSASSISFLSICCILLKKIVF